MTYIKLFIYRNFIFRSVFQPNAETGGGGKTGGKYIGANN